MDIDTNPIRAWKSELAEYHGACTYNQSSDKESFMPDHMRYSLQPV